MGLQTRSIPYFPDSSAYFSLVRRLPRPVWLDSCAGSENAGDTDILCADPVDTLDLWEIDDQSVARINALQERLAPINPEPSLPFTGGCLGYLTYEANHDAHGIRFPSQPLAPLACIGLYDWALIQNHTNRQARLVFHPSCPEERVEKIIGLLQQDSEQPSQFALQQKFSASTPKAEYIEHIEAIKELINAGDCYQVNYAQHFSAPFAGDTFAAYLSLRKLSPTPLAAYMEFGWGAILSISPERFISLREGQVRTFPIKGTMPRGHDQSSDERNRNALAASQKDRAENLMIVDLMRNDLSRVCEPGSVKTPSLFRLRSFPTVHHLVSEISAELQSGKNALDLIYGCMPGGSISGAPKRRAMEIINQLERVQRSVYCGSIFYWSSCGSLDSSIAIRTIMAVENTLHCWGGGGITADSDPEKEWQETLDKVQPLMQRLQTS